MNEAIIPLLSELTASKNTELQGSGNSAIFAALWLAREKGRTKVIIPAEGGWYSYKHFPKLLGMELIELPTNWALIDPRQLEKIADSNSVLLFSTMGGYVVEQPCLDIVNVAHAKDTLVIGDITGSIGLEPVEYDFSVCSFGNHKPLDIGYGGMIGSKEKLDSAILSVSKFPKMLLAKLEQQLGRLNDKWRFYERKNAELTEKLSKICKLVYADSRAVNLLVEGTPERVVEFCKCHGLNYVICPRYHRVKQKAISIEIKKL